MPQIAEPITSLEQELELRIEWLEKGLKKIANGRDDMNPIYVKQQAQSILDGEPTTADEYNDEEDIQLGASIVKSNDEVSGVFMSDGKIKDIDYLDENTVRISDINEEIAKEWNRDREERINKESN